MDFKLQPCISGLCCKGEMIRMGVVDSSHGIIAWWRRPDGAPLRSTLQQGRPSHPPIYRCLHAEQKQERACLASGSVCREWRTGWLRWCLLAEHLRSDKLGAHMPLRLPRM